MPAIRKYDYRALHKQYVASELSIRELVRRNGIPEGARAGIQRIASREGWDDDRQKRRDRSLEVIVDETAKREAARTLRVMEVEDNALDMADEMIDQVRGRLKTTKPVKVGVDENGDDVIVDEPLLTVHPKDLGKLLDGIASMRGRNRPIDEEGKNAGGRRGSFTVDLPEGGGQVAILARYVDDVRANGGPIDDDEPAAGAAEAEALPRRVAGAGEGSAVQP